MEIYIYTHCNTHRYFHRQITRIFIISYYPYFLIRRNDRVRALHLLWFRNGGIIEHWLRTFYSPSTMIGLYESGLLLLRSSPFSLLLFFFCYTKEQRVGWWNVISRNQECSVIMKEHCDRKLKCFVLVYLIFSLLGTCETFHISFRLRDDNSF